MKSWTRTVLLGILAVGCIQTFSHGENPQSPAPDSKGCTQVEFYRDVLKLDREEMVDGYKQGGRRNAVWDAAATSALDLLALFSAQNSVEEITALPMYPK